MNKNKLKLFSCLLLLFVITSISFAQNPVDNSFNVTPSQSPSGDDGNASGEIKILPDGKLLIYGTFEVVNGTAGRLFKLNSDGSVDTSFNCNVCKDVATMSIVVQDDGKIIVAGKKLNARQSRLFRINADGSLDNSFTKPFDESNANTGYTAKVLSQHTDGKTYVSYLTQANGLGNLKLYRLNTDGSIDDTLEVPAIGSRRGGFVYGVTPLPNGKLYFYGTTVLGAISRLNSDGSIDETFERPAIAREGVFVRPQVLDIEIQTDGKIVAAGLFDSVNGISRKNFVRINDNGSLDLSFAAKSENLAIAPVDKYNDDKILILKQENIFAPSFPTKLTTDGNTDNSLNLPSNLVSVKYFKLDTTTNKIYVFGSFEENGNNVFKFARLNADGSLDSSFNTNVGDTGIINGLAIQSDQKTVLVGEFDSINGVSKSTIARVNPNGTIDTSFDAGTGFYGGTATDLVIADDGKMYVYGSFDGYDGNAQVNLIRLNSDGTIDSSFAPDIEIDINVLKLQSDGKILIGGFFLTNTGQNSPKLARLNSDGSFDSSFSPVFGSISYIQDISVQNDGKVVVGGAFNGVGGFNRRNIARLNADGSYDSSFNPTVGSVKDILQLPSGKYLVADAGSIKRFNSDGSLDSGFESPIFDFVGSTSDSTEIGMRLLDDDSLIVFGGFDKVDDFFHQGIVRLFPDGTWGSGSYPNGTSRGVFDVELQDDGKAIIGGSFSLVENVLHPGIARLEVPILTRAVDYDFDGDGKADIAVFRPSENRWYVLRSSDFGVTQQVFGIDGDSPLPADFDGDGKLDYSIFRNSLGDWWSQSSVSGSQVFAHLGQDGDIPRPSDFDGDGRADYVVYRPSNFFWYRTSATGVSSNVQFGTTGDKPVIGDYDGDNKSDVAIYRPSTGIWWYQSSVDNSQKAIQWGISTDIPSPGDYDGDGITDVAIYRPSTGVWWIYNSSTQQATIIQFGIAEDKPVPADYDGDGKVDIAVYRPSTGIWYLLQSTNGFAAYQFGISTDIPIPNSLIQ